MPIFDYKCKKCNKEFEYFHLGPNDKEAKCPHCESTEAEKLPAQKTDFILKGGGWAKDKYEK